MVLKDVEAEPGLSIEEGGMVGGKVDDDIGLAHCSRGTNRWCWSSRRIATR